MTFLTLWSTARDSFSVSWADWNEALCAAQDFGWTPQGTCIDGAGPYWCGVYRNDGWHGAYMTADDVAGLAAALAQARTAAATAVAQPIPMPIVDELTVFIQRARATTVYLLGNCEDVPDYCWCDPEQTIVGNTFDELHRASTTAWRPLRDFDPWLVSAAVRLQVEGTCASRHLSSRAGLAQAICGHLQATPTDTSLSDPELLRRVEHAYYPNHSNVVTERDDGATKMFRNANERRERHPNPPQALPSMATPGPWWRAAHILRDCETALIASGVEWLYRRRWQVRHGTRTFGPGQHPAEAVAIPHLDFDEVQHEIFGGSHHSWPTHARCATAGGDDPAMLAAMSELHGDVTDDVDTWERVTGLSMEDLFPERAPRC